MKYRTTRELTITWSAGGWILKHETTIPKGYEVERQPTGWSPPGHVCYVCGPSKALGMDPSSIEWHDATYYGVPIPMDAVEEVEEPCDA